MAPRSKFSMLPQELRDELIDRLLDSDFSGLDELTAWLNAECEARGIEFEDGPISRSAIGRISKRHKNISKRLQEIRIVEREFATDPIRANRTTNQLLQMLAFAKTRDAMNGSIEVDEAFLKDMALTIGRLEKAAAINEDRERDIREDERRRATEEAAKAAENTARKAGVSPETIEAIRRDVLGMS